MHIIFILIISILLQFTAAFLAIRLVWITKKALAWVVIASAISIMALRRCISFYQWLFYVSPTPLDQTTEVVAMVISILMVVGVALLAPLFASIKRSEEELRSLLVKTCMDGIVANDLKGNIFTFNETAAKILGYDPEVVVGKMNVRELYPPKLAQEIKSKIHDPSFGGKDILENYETVVRHKDGTLVPIWLTARIIYEDGREVGVVGHFRDLRERKRMEEELLRSERLSALGRMAAHISHEIKNPLMLIGGFARQVLKETTGDPQKNQEKLQIIVDEVQRLEGFLAEVGGYAKISEPQKTLGDLNALLRETCQRLQPSIQERGLTLRLELEPDLPQVQFDPVHLRQVILNVAKNGIEAMNAGGTLTISSGRKAGQVFVKISDTGEGIPPEVMEKIFHPFFSTKPKGSGLGLAISQKIMEAHQGKITIESEPHHGTRVTCFLNLNL
jgi:two-component system NtrC family sensor kinase